MCVAMCCFMLLRVFGCVYLAAALQLEDWKQLQGSREGCCLACHVTSVSQWLGISRVSDVANGYPVSRGLEEEETRDISYQRLGDKPGYGSIPDNV